MSAQSHAGDAGHGHGDEHGHDGHPHGSLKSYLTGFVLAAVLTIIPFWLVMTGVLGDKQATALVIMAFAAVQIVVHMIYFLHMSPRSEGGWILMALIFTLVLVGIALSGSMWVMYHLVANMAPTIQDMSKLP